MNNLADQTRQAMSALAYGDIGAPLGQREQRAARFPNDAGPEPMTAAPSRKWIALGLGDTLTPPVMSYVIAACRRMQADLLLLCVDAMRVRKLLAEYLPEMHGIECRSEELANTSSASVLRVLNLHSGLLFAVSGAENDPVRQLLRARRGLRSPVPVVLVSPKSLGVPAPRRMKRARP